MQHRARRTRLSGSTRASHRSKAANRRHPRPQIRTEAQLAIGVIAAPWFQPGRRCIADAKFRQRLLKRRMWRSKSANLTKTPALSSSSAMSLTHSCSFGLSPRFSRRRLIRGHCTHGCIAPVRAVRGSCTESVTIRSNSRTGIPKRRGAATHDFLAPTVVECPAVCFWRLSRSSIPGCSSGRATPAGSHVRARNNH